MSPTTAGPLRTHGRFAYSAINSRPDYHWIQEGRRPARLAVYLGFNIEHFAFGEGLGARIGPASREPDVLNYSWREYGNRVGAWRCLELFEQLSVPTGCLINTAIYEHCPDLVQAFVDRGDEIIGHGYSNAFRQSDLAEAAERDLLVRCRDEIALRSGTAPHGWLSPWISESAVTTDLLAETGYAYTLNWAHDDQPQIIMTRGGGRLWAIPYPQELNDIPMIIYRQMDSRDFAEAIIDNLDEMLEQSVRQPLVMGIALHPYIVGQPYRIRHLRRALERVCQARDEGRVWFTTPGEIYRRVEQLENKG